MSDETTGTSPVRTPTVRPAPRIALRAFWLIHRSIYGLTGGRLGLSRPETGAKFGMMRLHTLGRRSGQSRVAMVGYYEDGPNLVTMAMNGWGKTEPAWWLNLQSTADATVDLPDGPRAVRARAASGKERERLWTTFADYPGWGTDIDALAGFRPSETAVVVLEPRNVAGATGGAEVPSATPSPGVTSDRESAAVAARPPDVRAAFGPGICGSFRESPLPSSPTCRRRISLSGWSRSSSSASSPTSHGWSGLAGRPCSRSTTWRTTRCSR